MTDSEQVPWGKGEIGLLIALKKNLKFSAIISVKAMFCYSVPFA